jgi:outer membrane protein TolC
MVQAMITGNVQAIGVFEATRSNRHVAWRISTLALVLLAFAASASAQFGTPSSAAQGSEAAQLPLSGRSAQSGSVAATEEPVPGATTSVTTLNPAVQASGAYAGSTSSTAGAPFSGKLSLREAIQRGLDYNLGAVGLAQTVRQAHGETLVARSALLPNLNGTVVENLQTSNLQAVGLHFTTPTFTVPTVVGPFTFLDVRAHLAQTVADMTALNNYRSSQQTLAADNLSAQDARDLIVLAVGGAYLQVIAAQARVASAHTQVDTANALYQLSLQQFQFGRVPQLDVNRSQVEALTEQQRLITLENDLAKQKINLARLTGLPVSDQYELTDDVPFAPAPEIGVEDALKQAFDRRPDLKAAEAQIRAAEFARSAARDERLPSLGVNADLGEIGLNPAQLHATYTLTGTLRVPIWQGGRASGDIEAAEAALTERRAELEDAKGQIETQVREVYLDLQAAANQVQVAQQNLQVVRDTLAQTRMRLEAGMSNNVELVQAQESVAGAELDYINSVFAHNVAKLSLARALGRAADSLPQFLKMQ